MARVFVITGPSGVGKGTLIGELRERLPGLELSVSATTRSPREGEVNGRDYHFLDPAEFERLVEAGAFLEHASYSGHRYGTLRDEVERRLARGRAVLLEIEVQGARQIRGSMPEAVQVFIAPPDEPDIRRQLDDLRSRLEGRGLDDPAEIERRLEVALVELKARKEEFEGRGESSYVVVNDEIERAASELETIVRRELSLQSSEP